MFVNLLCTCFCFIRLPTLNISNGTLNTRFPTVGTDGALATRGDSTLGTRGKGGSLSFGTSSDALVRKEKAGNTNRKRKKRRVKVLAKSRKKKESEEDGEWLSSTDDPWEKPPEKKKSRQEKKVKSSKRNEEKRKKR